MREVDEIRWKAPSSGPGGEPMAIASVSVQFSIIPKPGANLFWGRLRSEDGTVELIHGANFLADFGGGPPYKNFTITDLSHVYTGRIIQADTMEELQAAIDAL